MNWNLFFSIYTLIFIAELPDKTAFATLLLAARGRAQAVFLGVAGAFLIQTLVAVTFGSALSLLPEKWVHFGSGLIFIGFAVLAWRQRNRPEDEDEADFDSLHASFWPCVWKSFMVIFIAEWGDLTQLATASMTAKYGNDKLTVFTAALLALWSVTAVAVVLGRNIERWVKPRQLQALSAILFLGIGLYFFFEAFAAR